METRPPEDGRWQSVDRAVFGAMAQRAFPGAVILAARGDRVLLHRAYGLADIFRKEPMLPETVFDLASLTKPLATTLVAMVLAAQGELDIDRPVADLLPAPFSSAAPRFTSRMLMTHTAGLAAWRPYFQMLSQISPEERKTAVRALLCSVLFGPKWSWEATYSPLGNTARLGDPT